MTNLTKQEINLRIAKLVFPSATTSKCLQDESVIVGDALKYDRGRSFKFNYTNWNDLMPLIVEHGISLNKIPVGWEGYQYEFYKDECVDTRHFTYDKNPQIALALCLLEVLEEKDNKK